jgi:surface carbohydrate biosynthesis protein
MKDEKYTVVLPIEIKRRELAGKLLLASTLVRRGYEVNIGSLDINSSLDILEPDVYFALSAVRRKVRLERLKKLEECNTTTVVLDTEGSAFGGVEEFRPRVSPEILEYTDLYCAWGSKAATAAARAYDGDDLQIEQTGNPRFDVLQKPFRKVYESNQQRIQQQYGDFILVNTNFSVNHQNIDHHRNSALNDLTDMYQIQSRLIGNFIDLVCEISKDIDDMSVVLRPHPSEDPLLYEKLFFPYDDVYVTNEGEVRPWILAANAVIHNNCTTGVTSAMLGTPVFSFTPDGLFEGSVPDIVSESAKSSKKLIQKVKDAVRSNQEYIMDSNQKSVLSENIDNLDYSSSEKIAGIIDSFDLQNRGTFNDNFDISNKRRLKRILVKTLGDQRFEKIYYDKLKRGRDTEYKFSNTTTEEIINKVDEFPDRIIPDDIVIRSIDNVRYGFELSTENECD